MLVGMLFGDQACGGKGVSVRADGDDILLGGWSELAKSIPRRKGSRGPAAAYIREKRNLRRGGPFIVPRAIPLPNLLGDDDTLLGANMFTRGVKSIGKGVKKAALAPVRVFTSAKSPLDLAKRVVMAPYTVPAAAVRGLVINPTKVVGRTAFSTVATAGRFTGKTTHTAFRGTGHIIANVGRGTGKLAKSGLKIAAPALATAFAAKMGVNPMNPMSPSEGAGLDFPSQGQNEAEAAASQGNNNMAMYAVGGIALLGLGFLAMKKK